MKFAMVTFAAAVSTAQGRPTMTMTMPTMASAARAMPVQMESARTMTMPTMASAVRAMPVQMESADPVMVPTFDAPMKSVNPIMVPTYAIDTVDPIRSADPIKSQTCEEWQSSTESGCPIGFTANDGATQCTGPLSRGCFDTCCTVTTPDGWAPPSQAPTMRVAVAAEEELAYSTGLGTFHIGLFGDGCNPKKCPEWDCAKWCHCFETNPNVEAMFESAQYSTSLAALCPEDDTACQC